MKQKLAVITGADGGMGMEITRAVATAGYKVIMACRDPEIAEEKRQLIMRETGNIALEIVPVNLASLSSTASFANELLQRGEVITLLMNNAGTMETRRTYERPEKDIRQRIKPHMHRNDFCGNNTRISCIDNNSFFFHLLR